MTEFWKLDDVFRAALEVKEKGRTVILIDEKIVPIKDLASLNAEVDDLLKRIPVVAGKVQQSGAFFFAPPQIRQAIGQLGDFFEKVDLENMDSSVLTAYRGRLNELGKLLRKEGGLD